MLKQKRQYIAFSAMLLMLFSFQILRTQLRVTVKDDSGKVRPGTQVSLYNTAQDFNNNKEAFAPIISDKKGRAIFKQVGKVPYLLEAQNGAYSNDFGEQLTDTLKEGVINKIEVVISK